MIAFVKVYDKNTYKCSKLCRDFDLESLSTEDKVSALYFDLYDLMDFNEKDIVVLSMVSDTYLMQYDRDIYDIEYPFGEPLEHAFNTVFYAGVVSAIDNTKVSLLPYESLFDTIFVPQDVTDYLPQQYAVRMLNTFLSVPLNIDPAQADLLSDVGNHVESLASFQTVTMVNGLQTYFKWTADPVGTSYKKLTVSNIKHDTKDIITLRKQLFQYYNVGIKVQLYEGRTTDLLLALNFYREMTNFGPLFLDFINANSIDIYEKPRNDTPNGIKIISDAEPDRIYTRFINLDSEIITYDQIDDNVAKPINMTSIFYDSSNLDEEATYPTVDEIAQEELTVSRYSHEITFKIHKSYPRLNELLRKGTLITPVYRGKSYDSIINGWLISSIDEYVTIYCGAISSSLSSLFEEE